MLDKPDVTRTLARFVTETLWDDIPEEVRHDAKRAILNILAVGPAGSREPATETMLRTLGAFAGAPQAAVIGRRERLDALSAAFINAASCNMQDFCDTHLRTVIHPTAPIAPALFALGALRKVDGRAFIAAFVLGVEIACRIGNAISPGHYTKGWHITATCGVFGAAAGASRLIGLDATKLGWALGMAATQSSGLCECLGWPAKSVGVGNAARNGLVAALLAEQGFEGPAEPIAGKQGFLNAMGEPPDWTALTGGLGTSWEIRQNALKPYPCGVVMHPVLDCVLDWRRGHPDAEVERVTVRGHPLLSIRADRPDVTTGRESQVSVQHAVAAALVRGAAGIAEFSDACVNDAAVLALRRKVALARDEAIPTIAAQVEVVTADGACHALATRAARGSAQNPMSDRAIEDKLRACARNWRADYDPAPLIAAVWRLEDCADVTALLALTVPGS